MRIFFANLPHEFAVSRTNRWPEKTKSTTLYYPYWLCQAAGVCISGGNNVNVVDYIVKNRTLHDLIADLESFKPDLLVTETTTSTCVFDFQTIRVIKEKFPGVKIAVGGNHVTALPEKSLDECPSIDFIMRGEYDFTVRDLAASLACPDKVDGVSFMQNGEMFNTPNRVFKDDLDDIPFVSKIYKQFLDVYDYGYSLAKHPMIQIFSSRGCPYQCNYCSYPSNMSGRKLRCRSTANFVDELQYISQNMTEIKEIFIEDDTFTIDKERVAAICDEIRKRSLKIEWSVNARADVPYDLMVKMKEAGCRLLVVGFESGNQKILDNSKKGITLEQSREFMKNAKKAKLKVFGCFMLGLQGDTRVTMEDTFRFAKEIEPDMVFFQQAVPFPFTEFYLWAKESGRLVTEDYGQWLDRNGHLRALVNYDDIKAEEMLALRDRYMSRYYFSPMYVCKTLIKNMSWQEFKRIAKAMLSYLSFRLEKKSY